jgi:hypothetical protein
MLEKLAQGKAEAEGKKDTLASDAHKANLGPVSSLRACP